MGIGKRVKDKLEQKQIADKRKYSQVNLIKFVLDIEEVEGKHRAAFSRYLSEEHKYPNKYIPKTAIFLGCDPIELITNDTSTNKKLKPVPIVANTSCGATQVSTFQLENEVSYIREDKWNSDLYCVIANGESMFPMIHDQAEVIINPLIEPMNGNLVLYKLDGESAIKVLVVDEEAHMIQFVPINSNDDFKTKTIRLDDEDTIERLTIHKVHRVINPDANNREAILKMIGR